MVTEILTILGGTLFNMKYFMYCHVIKRDSRIIMAEAVVSRVTCYRPWRVSPVPNEARATPCDWLSTSVSDSFTLMCTWGKKILYSRSSTFVLIHICKDFKKQVSIL
jgi:hypothetical protein